VGDNRKQVKIHRIFFKNLLQNQQANFNQTWYKSSLGKENLKLYKSRAVSLSKGRYLQTCKNGVGSFKSLLTTKTEKLRFPKNLPDIVENQVVKIIVAGGRVGPQ
jgi:hypothetical protein